MAQISRANGHSHQLEAVRRGGAVVDAFRPRGRAAQRRALRQERGHVALRVEGGAQRQRPVLRRRRRAGGDEAAARRARAERPADLPRSRWRAAARALRRSRAARSRVPAREHARAQERAAHRVQARVRVREQVDQRRLALDPALDEVRADQLRHARGLQRAAVGRVGGALVHAPLRAVQLDPDRALGAPRALPQRAVARRSVGPQLAVDAEAHELRPRARERGRGVARQQDAPRAEQRAAFARPVRVLAGRAQRARDDGTLGPGHAPDDPARRALELRARERARLFERELERERQVARDARAALLQRPGTHRELLRRRQHEQEGRLAAGSRGEPRAHALPVRRARARGIQADELDVQALRALVLEQELQLRQALALGRRDDPVLARARCERAPEVGRVDRAGRERERAGEELSGPAQTSRHRRPRPWSTGRASRSRCRARGSSSAA